MDILILYVRYNSVFLFDAYFIIGCSLINVTMEIKELATLSHKPLYRTPQLEILIMYLKYAMQEYILANKSRIMPELHIQSPHCNYVLCCLVIEQKVDSITVQRYF